MKNLLYKEFRLAIRPSVYIFFALAALLLDARGVDMLS